MTRRIFPLFAFIIMMSIGLLGSILVEASSFVTSAEKEQTVFVTKTGKKYHQSTCGYLKNSSIEISLSEAKISGYTACSKCMGGKADSSKKGITTQCTGTTRAGNQCKRMTKNSNGRCYQH